MAAVRSAGWQVCAAELHTTMHAANACLHRLASSMQQRHNILCHNALNIDIVVMKHHHIMVCKKHNIVSLLPHVHARELLRLPQHY